MYIWMVREIINEIIVFLKLNYTIKTSKSNATGEENSKYKNASENNNVSFSELFEVAN